MLFFVVIHKGSWTLSRISSPSHQHHCRHFYAAPHTLKLLSPYIERSIDCGCWCRIEVKLGLELRHLFFFFFFHTLFVYWLIWLSSKWREIEINIQNCWSFSFPAHILPLLIFAWRHLWYLIRYLNKTSLEHFLDPFSISLSHLISQMFVNLSLHLLKPW